MKSEYRLATEKKIFLTAKEIEPENISVFAELDEKYKDELLAVKTAEDFENLIKKWDYWLDDETKKLTAKDWEKQITLIADCRKENVNYGDEHKVAMAIVMPRRLLEVSLYKSQFSVCWGLMYNRLKETGKIKY